MTVQEAVVQQGISSDAAYAGYIARDLSDKRFASFAAAVSLCLVPYLSLFAHESYRKLKTTNPALASTLSGSVEAIVARSRHSLKLFEDTNRGIDGQLAYFRDEILPAHAGHFLGNTWFPPARRWERDLGLFTYDTKLITTTHGAAFHMGVDPKDLLVKAGPEIRMIYAEYGRYFAGLGARLDGTEATFISRLDPQHFNRRPIDVHANKYYRDVFDGPSNSDLNAMLTVFQGMLNFANSVIREDQTIGTAKYTIFKIRFLTLYQILRSLRVLHDQKLRELTSRSVSYVQGIIGTAAARLITNRAAKPFRNTLIHYNLDSRIDTAEVDVSGPLFGLVPIYYPSHDATTFMAAVDLCICETAAALNQWAHP